MIQAHLQGTSTKGDKNRCRNYCTKSAAADLNVRDNRHEPSVQHVHKVSIAPRRPSAPPLPRQVLFRASAPMPSLETKAQEGAIHKMHKSISNRKNSWVMIAETGGYTPLPGEQTLYTSPPRTTLSLQTPNRHTPSQSYSQQCKSGVVYLTNRRVRCISLASPLLLCLCGMGS